MRILVYDTETTGFSIVEDEVIELGAVICDENGNKLEEFGTFIKPEKPIRKSSIKIHGITDQMVSDAPPARQAFAAFRKFAEGADCIVAHNAQFDARMTVANMKKVQLKIPEDWVFWDSVNISKFCATRMENYKLQTLLKKYDIDPGNAHRAVDDARGLCDLLIRFIEDHGIQKVKANGTPFNAEKMDIFNVKVPMHLKRLEEEKRFIPITYALDGEQKEMSVRHMFFFKQKKQLFSLCREEGKERVALNLNYIRFRE